MPCISQTLLRPITVRWIAIIGRDGTDFIMDNDLSLVISADDRK